MIYNKIKMIGQSNNLNPLHLFNNYNNNMEFKKLLNNNKKQ